MLRTRSRCSVIPPLFFPELNRRFRCVLTRRAGEPDSRPRFFALAPTRHHAFRSTYRARPLFAIKPRSQSIFLHPNVLTTPSTLVSGTSRPHIFPLANANKRSGSRHVLTSAPFRDHSFLFLHPTATHTYPPPHPTPLPLATRSFSKFPQSRLFARKIFKFTRTLGGNLSSRLDLPSLRSTTPLSLVRRRTATIHKPTLGSRNSLNTGATRSLSP